MIHEMLAVKIHNATVTDANIEYMGSISIDKNLLKKTGIHVNELVHIWNLTNGERLVTYVIEGSEGEITINGAAARKVNKCDKIIIALFRYFDNLEIRAHKPKIIYMDENNKIIEPDL